MKGNRMNIRTIIGAGLIIAGATLGATSATAGPPDPGSPPNCRHSLNAPCPTEGPDLDDAGALTHANVDAVCAGVFVTATRFGPNFTNTADGYLDGNHVVDDTFGASYNGTIGVPADFATHTWRWVIATPSHVVIDESGVIGPCGQTTLPPTTLPATTLPATTLPATTLPATTLPATTLPATTLPATTIPSTTTPDTTTPETTTPETPPSTSPPSTSQPPDTTPDTTAPETSTSTSTTAPTSSTSSPGSTTTTPASSTTPNAPPSFVTAPPQCQPQTPPATTPPECNRALPQTGNGVGAQIALAVGLMLLGTALIAASRRRTI